MEKKAKKSRPRKRKNALADCTKIRAKRLHADTKLQSTFTKNGKPCKKQSVDDADRHSMDTSPRRLRASDREISTTNEESLYEHPPNNEESSSSRELKKGSKPIRRRRESIIGTRNNSKEAGLNSESKSTSSSEDSSPVFNINKKKDQKIETFEKLRDIPGVDIQTMSGVSTVEKITYAAHGASAKTRFKTVNQDCFLLSTVKSGQPLVTVFDGHGCLGHVAARICCSLMPQVLAASLAAGETPEDAALSAFQEAQQLLLRTASAEQQYFDSILQRQMIRTMTLSPEENGEQGDTERRYHAPHVDVDYGTTATMCFLSSDDQNLCIAHAGDSKCVVLKRPSGAKKSKSKWAEMYSTLDHNCFDDDEASNVEKRGGTIFDIRGDLRVFPTRMTVREARRRGLSLNMTRSLGHIFLSEKAGISSMPDIRILKLESDFDYIAVVASDGLWDHVSTEELLEEVNALDEFEKQSTRSGASKRMRRSSRNTGNPALEAVITKLMKRAMEHMNNIHFGDNLTTAIIHLAR